jgi:hypothetical protein
MNKNWQIPRRAFLRGMGTVVALPVLEAMFPAGRLLADTVGGAAAKFPKRMAFVYVPNGVNMSKWTPEKTGVDYELSPTLSPLAPHQKDFTVLSGLTHKNAFGNGDGGGDHARACATYLTGKHPKKSASDIHAGISVDQVAANKIGDNTRLPSLELSCDRGQEAGSCDSGYSCAYQFNISWRSETQPMNPEIEPKQAFERLFGAGTSEEARLARAKRDHYDQSILDLVQDQAKNLENKLGTTDRRKLDEYFTSIRDVEKRIQQNGVAPPVVPDGAMGDMNADYTFERHMKLMFDLMTLSFQTDTTRIATFLVSHDGGNRPYPFIGVAQGHHHISHHRNQANALANLAIIDKWHVKQFAYFLDKLKSVKEGDGTLLDNCMIAYGGGISDGNEHSHDNLPTIVAGRGGGAITPGRHLKFDKIPMSNFYVSLLNRMGVPAKSFGDSSGALEEIS